jgi:hypothetical protein
MSAVGLKVGARADRIARDQTEMKVLEADIGFRAKQKRPLVDALGDALAALGSTDFHTVLTCSG